MVCFLCYCVYRCSTGSLLHMLRLHEEFQSERKTSRGRPLHLIGWWPLIAYQSDTILTVWLRVFPSSSYCVSLCIFLCLQHCMHAWVRVYVSAGCYNLELWRRGRGEDREAEEIDEKERKRDTVEEKKKGGGQWGEDRCWGESDSESTLRRDRQREWGGGRDDLLEEAAASLIFTGTKAAARCYRDDGLLALWTVDGWPNGKHPKTCLNALNDAVSVLWRLMWRRWTWAHAQVCVCV